MKKRFALLGILICSILCMFGCNNDPYKNMTLDFSGESTVQLNIEEVDVDGQETYSYSPYTFDVTVKNVGDDIDKKITLSGGEDLVSYSLAYIGDGVTRVNVTPLSYAKTGKFTLTIRTLEGNISKAIDFQIDLKINNFTTNDENLKVIAKGQSIDLNAIDKYINFYPAATTQKNITFDVVRPEGNVIPGHSDHNYVYNDESGEIYAEVVNGVLKTYKNVEYPKMVETVVIGDGESQILTPCITLRAHSNHAYNYDEDGNIISQRIPDRFVDIVVIDNCENITLKMNCQKNDSDEDTGNYGNSFALEKNKNGEYDVTLLNPNYRYGMMYDTYYIERDLMFDFGVISDDGSYNPSDYYVTTTPVSESEAMPIALSYSALDNSFKVQAQKSGIYSHKFKIDHVNYPNIIDTEVVVNFHVIDVPTDIKVNGTVVKDEYKVYKNYGNSWGTRFTVSLQNSTDYTYFVFVKDQELGNNLKFYKADGAEQVFAICKEENGNKVVSSFKEGSGYSNFKSNETFYMRHNFETLPSESANIYIGVIFDVASSSYSDEVRDSYFVQSLLEFPLNLSFETGLQSLDFTKSKYIIDLTDKNYSNDVLDETGIKLFDLPAGQPLDTAINLDDIVYDKSLITVYPVTNVAENIISFYMKCNGEYKTGKTTLTIATKNGLKNSVEVETFIPTMYATNEYLTDEDKMPLSIGFNDGDVLYYFTGKSEVNPKYKYSIYKIGEEGQEQWGGYEYNSLQKLFMLKDTFVNLKFYDYLLTESNGQKLCTPIDITNQISVNFNYPGYAIYNNGKLSVSRVTEDINNPVIMQIKYNGGYIKVNDEGVEEYVSYSITQNIELYIYLPLQGVQVTTAKSVDIYVNESLGIYSKDLSKHTIISDFIPNEVKLGAQWNDNWFNNDLPVNLAYDINDVLASPIYLSDGSQLILYSEDGSKSKALNYSDIFRTTAMLNYTCPIESRLSDSLNEWIINESGYAGVYDWFVQNKIFNNNIVMVVNVYITQFSKLQNINSVKFSAKYASKITNFDLDISEDGVYFEKRENSTSQMLANIGYSIDATNAVNKEIMLINNSNVVFEAIVKHNGIENKGTIQIIGKGAGIEYLTAVPKDNIKSYNEITKNYEYYDNSLVQTFRVKVADGSENYPFEIRKIDDYVQMQTDVAKNDYFNYILTTNLNLSQISNPQIVFANIDGKSGINNFSLDGNYIYFRNGVMYSYHNSLNNFHIRKTINNLTEDVNIGLFESINQKVTLKNLTINNAKIEITINALNGHNANIGILAGYANSAKIYNSSVIGTISIFNKSADTNSSSVNIGGMIGYASGDVEVLGNPKAYLDGESNNAYNANVTIDYSQVENAINGVQNALNNHCFNVGGLIGLDSGSSYSTISNLKVLPNIIGTNYNSSVGGLIGNSNYAKIENVVIYPIITIVDKIEDTNNVMNVSTILGSGGNQKVNIQAIDIANSKVYFVKEGFNNWQDNIAVSISTASILNYGGLIGNLNNNNANISYSYIRGFYSEDLSNKYYANIYINAQNGGNIGGLVGIANNNKLAVNSSYYSADMMVNGNIGADGIEVKSYIGLILGNSNNVGANSEIKDSYGIGRVIVEYFDAVTTRTSIKGILNNIGAIGNVNLTTADSSIITGVDFDADVKSTSIANLQIDNVYSVINNNVYYFGKDNELIGIYKENKYLLGFDGIVSILGSKVLENRSGELFKLFGYNIIMDSDTAVAESNTKWIWNENANRVGGIAFAILLNSEQNKALYDLIPEKILVDRVSSTAIGIYDVSYSKEISGEVITKPQLIVFVNKNDGSNLNNYFDIALNSETSTISIRFDGKEIHTSFLEINGDMTITEDSFGTILSLQGFKVYPVGEGIATITLQSVLDKTVKLDIIVKVITGITSVKLDYDSSVETIGELGFESPIAYVDEVINISLQNENKIDGEYYNSTYNFGYKLQILDATNNGKISINGKVFEYIGDENLDTYLIHTRSLIVKGISIGEVKFVVSPVVYLDGLEYDENGVNYKVLDNISNTFTITCLSRARDIKVNVDELKIAPKNTTNFKLIVETSNVIIKEITDPETLAKSYKISILKPILIKVGSKEFNMLFSNNVGGRDVAIQWDAIKNADGSYTINSFAYEIDYELINFRFDDITITNAQYDAISSQNTYNLTFDVTVNFDKEYYRQNANNFNLNTIKYVFSFIPTSNTKLVDTIVVSISPNVLSDVFTNYYTRGELLVNSENESYPSENESLFVIPGTNGLLKITLDEEFNDSSYITVTLDRDYSEYVKIGQMAGVTNNYIDPDSEDITEYIESYKDVRFREEISNALEYGLELSKLTLNYNDDSYFSKTYFVKLFLDRNYGALETISLKITSYKVDETGTYKNLEKTITYTITQLPLIDVKVDNQTSAVLGKGIKKELQLNIRGISHNIDFSGLANNVTIVDENNVIANVLDIEYIKNGGKYYICADVTAELTANNSPITINFKAEELVWGVRETTSANLKIQVVDFEIDSISIERAIDGIVTIKHGENLILNTVINNKDIVIGNENNIKNYNRELKTNGVGLVDFAEYSAAGATIFDTTNSTYLSDGTLRLGYGVFDGDKRQYYPMDLQSTYNYILLKTGTTKSSDGRYRLDYYIIRGTGISATNNVLLRLTIPYVYVDGKLTITDQILGYNTIEVDFEIRVEDSSTYDRPNPIETQDDLIEACNAGSGDYILLNNIELEKWTPIDATFASLDGNGYIITVKSFNFVTLREEDTINVGIFANVSSSTLLKNITIDVSNMLVTEEELLNRLDKVSNSTVDNYLYDANIDLSYIDTVNFGILAGTNSGSITNARIINTSSTFSNLSSTKLYYHIVTTQGYLDSNLVVSKIGGIVGVNAETGAITNSYVGLNESTLNNGVSTIELVSNPSSSAYNNVDDTLQSVNIYPFVIAGGNNLAGITAENNGIISNSYVKGVGLYNTYPAVQNSTTGGLVGENNGTITSAYVGSVNTTGYRAQEDKFKIESTGNIGGLVYSNNGTIENAYSNVYLETQSAFTGGFVFTNGTTGYISNAYTTTVNRNNLARGQFTGIGSNGRDVLNSGTYYNCYYLVLDGENTNDLEYAKPIDVKTNDISNKNTWRGFSFTTASNSEGIWVLTENDTPRLASSTYDTNSFRRLTDTEEVTDGNVSYTVYTYEYITYNLGSKSNPLIIDKASNFATYIIDNSVEIDYNGKKERAFGIDASANGNILSTLNTVRYVRLVNNLDFEKITSSTMHKGTYLYKLIFAGVLDGNGMTLENLNINTDTIQLDNFGLFAQVGIDSDITSKQTVVKNLNMNLRTYKSSDSSRAGVLAGTIINSFIINVKINGNATNENSIVVGGRNMAGALAGLIYADNGGTAFLYDINIKDIAIEASYGSLGGEITDYSTDSSNGLFNKFIIKNADNEDVVKSFNSLYDNTSNSTNLFVNGVVRNDVSYAGTVAGVILANNYSTEISSSNELDEFGNLNYRTQPDGNTIDNVVVEGNITIKTADNSGGLFGYIGENTLIKNSKFILGSNQIIRAFNYAGGIVAENHGIIEQCYIALPDATQETIDNQIVNRDSSSTFIQLFDSLTTTNYTVAIGGIAGYSSNGVIIDSYSKVNVTKPLAYIAGGLIGYSENYNYIAFSYATGAVYSKFILGGIIGLQVDSDIDYELKTSTLDGVDASASIYTPNKFTSMDSVYALTDWNANIESYNFRQKITEKLYDNQKVLYSKNDGTYLKFYVKMPEIGNLNIAENYTNYLSLHNEYYVGSLVGYIMLNVPNNVSKKFVDYVSLDDLDLSTLNRNVNVITNLKNRSTNVVTNTLGMYSSNGSLAAGNKVDNYTTSVFNYYIDSTNYINMYSYRIAYISDLNKYTKVDIDEAKPDAYYDVFTYPEVYTQEYLEQIIGAYYQVVDNNNTSTASVFKYDLDKYNRFDKSKSSTFGTFINMNNDYIWTLSSYLPKYSYGLYASGKIIKNASELQEALSNVSSGRTYKIEPSNADYSITLENITDTNKVIAYAQTIRDMFVGIKSGEQNPKIIIKITNASGKESSKVNSLFNTLSGVTFANIDFEVVYSNVNFKTEKLYPNFGLFANSLQNVTINNCNFSIKVENELNIANSDDYGSLYNVTNVGVLFGEISNSNISSSRFEISLNNVIISAMQIENFGLFAGYTENSSIINNKYTIATTGIKIEKSNEYLNVAGLIGVLNHSTFAGGNSINITGGALGDFAIVNNAKLRQLNVSSLFAYSNNSSIRNIEFTGNLNITNNNIISEEMNISSIIAMSNSTNLSYVIVNGKLDLTDNSSINSLNIGSVIGHDLKSSKMDNKLVSSNNVITAISKSMNMSVGGIVGYVEYSANLINLAQFTGSIDITNNQIGTSTTNKNGDQIINTSKTNIGAIIGRASGLVGINNVLGVGKITANTLDNNLVELSIGGIIGRASSSEINNFSSLSDVKLIKNYSNAIVYVSGVIGNNNGIFTGSNGFVLFVLPSNTNISRYAITNNSVSKNTSNIYYCGELFGNDYSADSMFNTYALADLYVTISTYSLLGRIIGSNAFFANANVKTNKSLQVIIPTGTTLPANLDGAIFNPNVLSGSVTDVNLSGYNVILDNVRLTNTTLNSEAIVSGRTLLNGKAILTLSNTSGATDTKYAFSENNGVISNIYFKTSGDGLEENITGQNVTLVKTNNGIITNVYAYGMTESTYSIAYENTSVGKILKSASATIYVGASSNIYGLVYSNKGYISDTYSSNFGHTKNINSITTVYGLAYENLGQIDYSFYYIPEVMEYENTLRGICYSDRSGVGASLVRGKTYRCENSELPAFVFTRSTIWTTENEHGQILGIVDIKGAIVLKLKMMSSGSTTYDVDVIKSTLKTKSSTDYYFDYDVNFYSTEKLTYTIVRFNNGGNFANYINSIIYTSLPENTIVLIDGDITINTEIKSISIPSSSMILGLRVESSGKNSSITFDNKTYIQHELIRYNYGVIGCIEFKGFKFNNAEESRYFAPIMYNYGVVYTIVFSNDSQVYGGYSKIVAGIVSINGKSAVINKCAVTDFTIYSIEYFNYICNEDYGKVYNCVSSNMAGSGTFYINGKNGRNDND